MTHDHRRCGAEFRSRTWAEGRHGRGLVRRPHLGVRGARHRRGGRLGRPTNAAGLFPRPPTAVHRDRTCVARGPRRDRTAVPPGDRAPGRPEVVPRPPDPGHRVPGRGCRCDRPGRSDGGPVRRSLPGRPDRAARRHPARIRRGDRVARLRPASHDDGDVAASGGDHPWNPVVGDPHPALPAWPDECWERCGGRC